MRKAGVTACALTAGILLAGCAKPGASTFPPNQSAIYVSREGALYTSLTESYDPSDTGYDAGELRAMAEEEAAEYNRTYGAAAGQGPVSVAECKVEEGTAQVVYQYTGPEDLCRFTQDSQDEVNHPESLMVTTNSAYLQGEAGGGTWTDARKNTTVSLEAVTKKRDLPMVVVTGGVTVQTEGRILYYSGAVQLEDEYTARVLEGTAQIVFR